MGCDAAVAPDGLFLAAMAWVDGRELVPDAAVAAAGGCIRDIVPQAQLGRDVRASLPTHRGTLLLPGLINAHAHTEYTHMKGRLPRNAGFAEWVRAIIREKACDNDDVQAASVAEGLRQLAAGGVTTVVDTFSSDAAARALEEPPLRVVRLGEAIGLGDAGTRNAAARLRLVDDARAKRSAFLDTGLAPHAPYSVGPRLRAMLRDYLAAHADCPVSWHIAESGEEDELFRTGTGPLAGLLASLGLPMPFHAPTGCSPCAFLQAEGLLDRCDAAVHFNTARTEEYMSFGAPRALVHCPGTHAFFGRPPFDAAAALGAGANLCLGTDSLASSETLGMLDLLGAFARANPSLDGAQLLATVTTNPARARLVSGLGCPLGVIRAGAPADLVMLDIPEPLEFDLRPMILHPEARVSATFVNARQVYP